MTSCSDAGCGGLIASDGYCDTCGLAGEAASAATAVELDQVVASSAYDPDQVPLETHPVSLGLPSAPGASARAQASGTEGSSWALRSRGRTTSPTTSSTRTGVGAGLVTVAPTPVGDPDHALMTPAEVRAVMGEVPEEERFCSQCGRPVGRASAASPGRVQGFCGGCRTSFDFITNEPSLEAGELVAGQYEILGPLAHGGMGWIYLGRDKAVSDRWVVLKGLLNQSDPDAAAAAVAERRFLAQIDHSNIVNIYNFVTHRGAGYIVMEMVGGESLNAKLKKRRADNNGAPNPLPPIEAVAYILAVLPAFSYLHEHGLVYNDLKPANVMAVGSGVKLIDVGAVMRADDTQAAIFGTPGFQAPEIARSGPSPASDIFTIGRTLAVLMLNFVFHDGPHLYDLPPRSAVPVFARWESLHRFLLKATAQHPDDRFVDVDTMGVQLRGVLREMVAVNQGAPVVAASELFSADRFGVLLAETDTNLSVNDLADWRSLPEPKDRVGEKAGGFFETLPSGHPELAVQMLETVMERVDEVDIGLLLRYGREQLLLAQDPSAALDRAEAADPWEWRVAWYRGLWFLEQALTSASVDDAAEFGAQAANAFSRVWTDLPGELAPTLGLAMGVEYAGEYERAAALYERVFTVDETYATAAFGQARSLLNLGRREDALEALQRVPASSVAHPEAQLSVAALLTDPEDEQVSAEALNKAHQIIGRLKVDADQRAQLAINVYQAALGLLEDDLASPEQFDLGEGEHSQSALRERLEETYRARARLAEDPMTKYEFVDRANRVRPRTFT